MGGIEIFLVIVSGGFIMYLFWGYHSLASNIWDKSFEIEKQGKPRKSKPLGGKGH